MRDINMSPIRSIDRAIDILQAFTPEEPSLSVDTISKKTKIPNSTVYRILCTLERRGLVQFDETSVTYKPGLRLMEFSVLLTSILDIRQEAEDTLTELNLKTGQTVLMAIKEGDQILHISKKENFEGLKFASVVGQRRPYLYGALGPVLLAFSSEREIEYILDLPIDHYTQNTVTDKEAIRKRLERIRQEKVFVTSNETNMGVAGIAAPVFGLNGEIEASVAIVGAHFQIEEHLEEFKNVVKEAAKNISVKIGYRGQF